MFEFLRIFRILSFSIILLTMIASQITCSKYGLGERDAFIDSIKGEWRMSRIERISHSQTLIIQGATGSLFYILNWDTTVVNITDPILCTLPEIEKFQDWTITENKKDLHLVTRDLCGKIWNSEIKYENIDVSYDYYWGSTIINEDIKADVRLLGEEGAVRLEDFKISDDYTLEFNYTIIPYKYIYYLVR